MRTKERYIPAGYEKHVEKDGAVVFYGAGTKRFYAIGWRSAKQVNHDFHNSFLTADDRQKFVDNWLGNLARAAQTKQDQKDRRKAAEDRPNPFKERDVLVYSWGYDQTNVEFYQVVEVKDKSVVLRRIAKETVNDHGADKGMSPMSGRVVARRDVFLEGHEPVTKRVKWVLWENRDPEPRVSFDHGGGSLWDGSPQYESWYA